MIHTPSFTTPCGTKPVFVEPTPDEGHIFYVEPAGTVGVVMYAINEIDTAAT